MKMRNAIPTALLAVAAVFFLSGCDALLRAIYPTDNNVTVRVKMDARANPDYAYHDAVIQLYKSGAGLVAQQSVGHEYVFDGWAYYGITFKGIPDGQYSIKACFDRPHIHTFSTFGPWATAFLVCRPRNTLT
jgi:hypothetical protein